MSVDMKRAVLGNSNVKILGKAGYESREEMMRQMDYIENHTMKKKGGVQFSAVFDKPLPSDAVVKVAFHRDPPRTEVNPSHSGNIAK